MAQPEVIEDDSQRNLTASTQGIAAQRVFTVLARSQYRAMNALTTNKNITQGSVWIDERDDAPYPNLLLTDLRVETKSISTPNTDGMFEITAYYSTNSASSAQVPTLGGPPVYLWNIGLGQEPVDHALETDLAGAVADSTGSFPVTNSKHYAFSQPITKLFPQVSLTVKTVVTKYDVPTMIRYAGKTNTDNFLGAAPGQAICMGIVPDPIQYGYWMLNHNFSFREDGWRQRTLDQDRDGKLLDGSGQPLGGTSPAVFLHWTVQGNLPFSPLNIG
jgi:hypothetical protein